MTEGANRLISDKTPPTISVTGVDATGNQDTAAIHLLRENPIGTRLLLVSGNNQVAGIHEPLPSPLVFSIVDDKGISSGSPRVGRREAAG